MKNDLVGDAFIVSPRVFVALRDLNCAAFSVQRCMSSRPEDVG